MVNKFQLLEEQTIIPRFRAFGYTPKKLIQLAKFALLTRLFIIILQVLFNILVPDHAADAFRFPFLKEEGSANVLISFFFSGFTRWDAQYFLHIILYGYTHENTLAFFPLFPILVRLTSTATSTLDVFNILSEISHAILSGVLLNCCLFSIAAVFLYLLTVNLFESERFGYISAILFCINPGSVFFVTVYSETLFSMLTFGGLWLFESDNVVLGLIFMSLSTAARSNGMLLFEYIACRILKHCTLSNMWETNSPTIPKVMCVILKYGTFSIFIFFLFLLPFIVFQWFCYNLFCTSAYEEQYVPEHVMDFLMSNDFRIPSDSGKWCKLSVPISYSYVQLYYWNVGFLKYYTVNQIPNFLLAMPIFFIVVLAAIKYFILLSAYMFDDNENSCKLYYNFKLLPYFIHAVMVTGACTLFAHVQILTRMVCSSNPVLYWIAADMLLPKDERDRIKLQKDHALGDSFRGDLCFMKHAFLRSSSCGKIIMCYFICYLFVGTFLHVNFFPWT